ncbi:hypothetical protein IAR55_006308 [Kwoniella newhampshirensis]|uniref:Uncharacterized protein n=1 Tax=Kwoniella newhampshirensis TaxID=1651941 RepID=A0AAW0YUZ8_9TREE
MANSYTNTGYTKSEKLSSVRAQCAGFYHQTGSQKTHATLVDFDDDDRPAEYYCLSCAITEAGLGLNRAPSPERMISVTTGRSSPGRLRKAEEYHDSMKGVSSIAVSTNSAPAVFDMGSVQHFSDYVDKAVTFTKHHDLDIDLSNLTRLDRKSAHGRTIRHAYASASSAAPRSSDFDRSHPHPPVPDPPRALSPDPSERGRRRQDDGQPTNTTQDRRSRRSASTEQWGSTAYADRHHRNSSAQPSHSRAPSPRTRGESRTRDFQSRHSPSPPQRHTRPASRHKSFSGDMNGTDRPSSSRGALPRMQTFPTDNPTSSFSPMDPFERYSGQASFVPLRVRGSRQER